MHRGQNQGLEYVGKSTNSLLKGLRKGLLDALLVPRAYWESVRPMQMQGGSVQAGSALALWLWQRHLLL